MDAKQYSEVTQGMTFSHDKLIEKSLFHQPVVDTHMLSMLVGKRTESLLKWIQRDDSFPEPAMQSGRQRLWTINAIAPMLDERTVAQVPVHFVLDPFEDHQAEFKGTTINDGAVQFWFVIDGKHWVVYQHRTFTHDVYDVQRTGIPADFVPKGVTTVTCYYGPDLSAETINRFSLVSSIPLTYDVFVRGSDGLFETSRNDYVSEYLPHTTELVDPFNLVALIGTCLPVWPKGLEDPELMMQWKPGTPTQEVTLRSHREMLMDLIGDTESPRIIERYRDARAMNDVNISMRAYDPALQGFYLGANDPSLFLDRMLTLHDVMGMMDPPILPDIPEVISPFELVATCTDTESFLRSQGRIIDLGMRLRDDEPMCRDDTLHTTLAGYLVASMLGLPRDFLEWGSGDCQFWCRRPDGQWWSTRPFFELAQLFRHDGSVRRFLDMDEDER